MVQLLVDRGADPNKADEDGMSPLHWAALNGQKDVVQLLLDRGADPNRTDGTAGFTPLKAAVAWGHKDVVQLLEKGVNHQNPVQFVQVNED